MGPYCSTDAPSAHLTVEKGALVTSAEAAASTLEYKAVAHIMGFMRKLYSLLVLFCGTPFNADVRPARNPNGCGLVRDRTFHITLDVVNGWIDVLRRLMNLNLPVERVDMLLDSAEVALLALTGSPRYYTLSAALEHHLAHFETMVVGASASAAIFASPKSDASAAASAPVAEDLKGLFLEQERRLKDFVKDCITTQMKGLKRKQTPGPEYEKLPGGNPANPKKCYKAGCKKADSCSFSHVDKKK